MQHKHARHSDLYEAAIEARGFAARLWGRFIQKEYLTHKQGETMTKDEIALRVQVHSDIQLKQAREAVNAVFEAIQAAVDDGDRVEIRGFGSFAPVSRVARKGRNPRTGKVLEIPARRSVNFRPGKAFKEKLNNYRN